MLTVTYPAPKFSLSLSISVCVPATEAGFRVWVYGFCIDKPTRGITPPTSARTWASDEFRILGAKCSFCTLQRDCNITLEGVKR